MRCGSGLQGCEIKTSYEIEEPDVSLIEAMSRSNAADIGKITGSAGMW